MKTNENYIYSCEHHLQKQLNKLRYNDRSHEMMENGVLCFVACLSLSLTLFVAYTIFKNKKLRNIHPAKLIGVLSLCEFCTCWVVMWHTIGPVRMTCYTGINYSYLWTIQWIIPSYTMEQAIKDIVGWPLQLYDVC